MNCHVCEGGTMVTHTRTFQDYTRRRRVCAECGAAFTTYETLKPPEQRYPMGHNRSTGAYKPRAVCHYNSGVCCDQTSCDECGWNPNKRSVEE